MTNYIWDSNDYPWGEDPGLDILKLEYDKLKEGELSDQAIGINMPTRKQRSSDVAGLMKKRAQKTGVLIQHPNVQNSLNSKNSNVTVSQNKQNETSVTNPDGSITITRERIINNNGTMQTQKGTIRLMPQESAGGSPATISSDMKDRLFELSEFSDGNAVNVTSGTRTAAQNKWLVDNNYPAAPKSEHLVGNAADISIDSYTRDKTENSAYNSGLFGRVNNYQNSNGIHVDTKTPRTGTNGLYRGWVAYPTPGEKPKPPKRNK